MTIKDIVKKWSKEKEYYKTQELGSGVHSFIKALLESDEVFHLKEGSLSSKLESRNKEFIHENKAKEGRRADFVIYINSDIIIPLEAECYGNITAGITQLFDYQKDFDKHYGILTDGYTWRFYNNNIYRAFNLDQILNETDVFLEFWYEYIKPEFYYLAFFEPQGQQSLLKEIEKLTVEENRQIFFDDITKLIRSFNNKLNLEGYFENLEKKERGKKAVEITYAYVIQFILYKTLVDNEFGNFSEEFKNSVKKIHEHLKVNRYKDILGIIDGISTQISQNIYRPFAAEQEFISQKLLELYHSVENKLSDVSPWLDIFVFIKKYNFANIQNEIFGYIYENYLKELYEDKKKGQYFTDPAVVNFMLQQVGYTPDSLQKRYEADKNSISLIDPSCGSGTFLYSAVDSIMKTFRNGSQEKSKQIEEVVNNNIFGLDIAEFPLYLAEMNILMRLLPLIINEKYNNPIDKKIKVFLTKDSVSEFMDTALRNTFNDLDIEFKKGANFAGQISLFTDKLGLGYKSYVREESDLEEMKKSLENQSECPRRRFDYVIGNPPYISYNECSKQRVLITKLIQDKKAQMSNIYGVNLNTVPGRIKPYSPKPNFYSFFIALGIALLKDGGKLCYIIPQTVLTAGDLDVIRYHLAKFTTIEKIITFSGKMFIGRGLKQNKPVATSSLIFVLNRKIPLGLHSVEIINYLDPDDNVEGALNNILAGKKIRSKKILQNELLQNVANWNFIKQSASILNLFKDYKNNSIDIQTYRNKFPPKEDFYFDKGLVFKKSSITTDITKNDDYFYLCNFDRDRYIPLLTNNVVYLKNLIFPSGARGIEVYLAKYKIVWSYTNLKFYLTDDKIMIGSNWVIISGNNKEETLFLFSILNSKLICFIIDKTARSDAEKILIASIKTVKDFVRIPKISDVNLKIKDEIIKTAGELLMFEKHTLSDFVDFSKVMVQKIDSILVEDEFLVLEKDEEKIKLAIKENASLVKKVIAEKYSKNGLNLEEQKINLADLKNLPVIDFEKQKAIKEYIDDLVFALYFNISLQNLGINRAGEIREMCTKHSYYKLVSEKRN